MNKILVAILLVGCLSGCATTHRAEPAYVQSTSADSDEVDLVPPVPSFTTVSDCELAYGAGACGTGAAVYERAGVAVPVGAYDWFVPYAFGVMTGVLANHYFAPPGVYVAGFQYRSFTSTTVINNYKVINQTTINRFGQAPLSARAQALRTGPVRYSQSRGAVIGAARFAAGSSSSHSQNSTHTAVAATPTQRSTSIAKASTYNSSSTSRSRASSYSTSTYTSSKSAATSPTHSYSAPARSTPTYTPPTRTVTPTYSAPRAAQTTYSAPRPSAKYSSAPANTAAKPKNCFTSHCP
jgi:hypothetical protein